MGFCCGASMLGTIGTVRHKQTLIHDVPIYYCPICFSFKVHHEIRDEYEILAEYAHADQAEEVYLSDYVNIEQKESIFQDCIEVDGHPIDVLREQIDQALDLLAVAKSLQDEEWQKELLYRLTVLSGRLRKELDKSIHSTS